MKKFISLIAILSLLAVAYIAVAADERHEHDCMSHTWSTANDPLYQKGIK